MSTPVQVYDPNTQGKVGAGGQTINSVGTPPFEPFWAYYTGCTPTATVASRARIDTDLLVGMAVCFDPLTGSGTPIAASGLFPGDRAARIVGFDVTRPTTAILNFFAGIVTKVPDGSIRGGPIQITPFSWNIQAYVTNNGTSHAIGDGLCVTDGSFSLTTPCPTVPSASIASAAANQAGILNLLQRHVGICWTANASAQTDTLTAVRIGPCGWGGC